MESQQSSFLQYLPPEKICEILSYVTDITYISNFIRISPNSLNYTHCVEYFTSDRIVTTPLSFIQLFQRLIFVDHKIVIQVDQININLPPRLQHANFVVSSQDVLISLLKNLNMRGYFKISLILPNTLSVASILIKNGQFIIISNKRNYKQELAQLISEIHPLLIQLTYRPFYHPLRSPMIEFLRLGDFGLVDPDQPPSITNPPLSNYTQIIANNGIATTNILNKLFVIYSRYHQINQPDDLMKLCFGSLVESNKDKFPMDLASLDLLEPSFLTALNIILGPTIEDIALYNFSGMPTIESLNNLNNIIRTANLNYSQLVRRARQGNTYYYSTDGRLIYKW